MGGEVIDPRGKSTTAISLNQRGCNCVLGIYPYAQRQVSSHQSVFWQQMKTRTEIHSWSKCREHVGMELPDSVCMAAVPLAAVNHRT